MSVAAWEWGSYFPMEQRLKGIRLDLAEYRRPDPMCAPVHAKAAGLYAIGEAVDVTGWLGGYNFQWAWASGVAAGQAV